MSLSFDFFAPALAFEFDMDTNFPKLRLCGAGSWTAATGATAGKQAAGAAAAGLMRKMAESQGLGGYAASSAAKRRCCAEGEGWADNRVCG